MDHGLFQHSLSVSAGFATGEALENYVSLTLAGIVAYVFAPALVAFFVSGDADVVAEGARFIRVMSLVWGAIGVQLCIVSAFRASGNMLVAMVIAIVSQFMLPISSCLCPVESHRASCRRFMVVVSAR